MAWKSLKDFSGFDKTQLLTDLVGDETKIPDRIKKSIKVVANKSIQIPSFSCKINLGTDESLRNYTSRWRNKFIEGYNNRASQRASNPIGTAHDEILDDILLERIDDIVTDIEKVRYGHRLSMSAENIVGHLLEEYLFDNLINYGWHCCWGETMKSIDFCHDNGFLLQVKNSDNSENSSSNKVRGGTKIQHWYRRVSRTGNHNWLALNTLVGIKNHNDYLSEAKFKEFVKKTISTNPSAIHVEEKNPWDNKKKDIQGSLDI